MKKTLLATAVAAGLVLMGMQPVQAVEVKLSGQINRAIMWADNGNDSELIHVDNDNSSTRFRLTGKEQVSPSVKVGVAWETEFESNTSSGVDVPNNSDNSASFKERKLEAYFVVPFGKISIGQGDGAANGTSERDLSGTSVIMYSGVNDTAGSIQFRQGDNTAIAEVGDTRSNFDGLSRNDRLRYDTPKLAGFSLATSITNGDAWEVALRYASEFDGFGKIAAAVGYVDSDERSTPEFTQLGGSVSYLSPVGVNLTIAYGSRDIDGGTSDDPMGYYAKVGYKFGKHAIAVEYGMTEDLDASGDESSNYGLAYVAKPWSGVELYAAYRVYELDRTGVSDIGDINQFLVGTRVKF